MATRRFKISVGEADNNVVEEAGAAVNSDTVELTIECSATAIGGARQISRLEAIEAVTKIINHLNKCNWPPV